MKKLLLTLVALTAIVPVTTNTGWRQALKRNKGIAIGVGAAIGITTLWMLCKADPKLNRLPDEIGCDKDGNEVKIWKNTAGQPTRVKVYNENNKLISDATFTYKDAGHNGTKQYWTRKQYGIDGKNIGTEKGFFFIKQNDSEFQNAFCKANLGFFSQG